MKKSSVILAFIGPALLVYCIFVLYPIFSTFYYSLFEWSGIESGATFAGLSNYLNILSDNVFWMSLENNLLLVVASLLTQLPLGLLLALLLFAPIPGCAPLPYGLFSSLADVQRCRRDFVDLYL